MSFMRSLLVTIPLLLLAILIDAALLDFTHGVRLFDPFLVVVVAQAPYGRKADAIVTGGLAGFVQDMIATDHFGINYLSKVVIGYASSLLSSRLIPGQPMTALVLLGGGTLVEVAVQWLAGVLLGQSFDMPTPGSLAACLAANVVIGMPAVALVDRLARRRPRQVAHARGR
jgi:rod shape-determining protein MreD